MTLPRPVRAEFTKHVGDDRYRGRARVAVGPIRLSFAGIEHAAERDAGAHRLRVFGQGEDAGGGRTQADIVLVAEDQPGGGRLRATTAFTSPGGSPSSAGHSPATSAGGCSSSSRVAVEKTAVPRGTRRPARNPERHRPGGRHAPFASAQLVAAHPWPSFRQDPQHVMRRPQR